MNQHTSTPAHGSTNGLIGRKTDSFRGTRGRFATGNPGGPGRPRRPVEADYLRAISDACPLEKWREIVERAVEDARSGDAKAREWVSRHLVGTPQPGALTEAAAEELAGRDTVAARAGQLRMVAALDPIL
jgi:hypothetical protein